MIRPNGERRRPPEIGNEATSLRRRDFLRSPTTGGWRFGPLQNTTPIRLFHCQATEVLACSTGLSLAHVTFKCPLCTNHGSGRVLEQFNDNQGRFHLFWLPTPPKKRRRHAPMCQVGSLQTPLEGCPPNFEWRKEPLFCYSSNFDHRLCLPSSGISSFTSCVETHFASRAIMATSSNKSKHVSKTSSKSLGVFLLVCVKWVVSCSLP